MKKMTKKQILCQNKITVSPFIEDSKRDIVFSIHRDKKGSNS